MPVYMLHSMPINGVTTNYLLLLYCLYHYPTSTSHTQLLAPEIRREQNAILQCIHYIIEQDFFEQNSNSPTPAGDNRDCQGENST